MEEDGRLTTAFCSAVSTLTVCKEEEEEEDDNGGSAEDLIKQWVERGTIRVKMFKTNVGRLGADLTQHQQ